MPSPGADPAKAVAIKLSSPVDLQERVFEGLGVEPVDFLVLKVAAPLVDNIVLGWRAHVAEG
jgi:hypothetical protein